MELRYTIAARLRLLHRWSCPWASDAPPPPAWRGEYGELAAASWARAQGWLVLRQRFRRGHGGEVDLVCRDGDTLVFAEVKSTVSQTSGSALRRVDREKRMLIRRGARNWLRLLGREVPYRFDLIEVYLPAGARPQITHYPAAFGMKEGEQLPLQPREGCSF